MDLEEPGNMAITMNSALPCAAIQQATCHVALGDFVVGVLDHFLFTDPSEDMSQKLSFACSRAAMIGASCCKDGTLAAIGAHLTEHR